METSDDEEDITKLPLKKVIEKLYERIKRKDRRILLSKAKIGRLIQENHVVRAEFDSLKSVAESWLNEKQNLINRIAELEHELAVLKEDSSSYAALLQGQIDKMTIEYEQKIKNFHEDKHKFQKELGSEIIVHEAIKKRQQEYIDVLKKELILAQNIIRTPVLLEHANKKFNFDDVEFYKHEPAAAANGLAT